MEITMDFPHSFKEMGIPAHLRASWEIYMQIKKQQLELDMEQQTGSTWNVNYILYYFL